jgi:hypothetical protein
MANVAEVVRNGEHEPVAEATPIVQLAALGATASVVTLLVGEGVDGLLLSKDMVLGHLRLTLLWSFISPEDMVTKANLLLLKDTLMV